MSPQGSKWEKILCWLKLLSLKNIKIPFLVANEVSLFSQTYSSPSFSIWLVQLLCLPGSLLLSPGTGSTQTLIWLLSLIAATFATFPSWHSLGSPMWGSGPDAIQLLCHSYLFWLQVNRGRVFTWGVGWGWEMCKNCLAQCLAWAAIHKYLLPSWEGVRECIRAASYTDAHFKKKFTYKLWGQERGAGEDF